MEIRTDRLRLVLLEPAEVLARIDAMSSEERAEVSDDWLARIRASEEADPWLHGFSVVDTSTGLVVGSCGYKGPPDAEGSVEIAYGVHPDYQGRGYATEAARALIDLAFEGGRVRLVRAHTMPRDSASTRVLMKCGFKRAGEFIDPEDGLVWRWERNEQHPRGAIMTNAIPELTTDDLQAFADAWNRHDADAIMTFMTEDCVFESSAGPDVCGTRHAGRQAVRASFVDVWTTFPDAHWGNARHFVQGDRGVSEWIFTGTRADGSRVEVNGCDLFTFRDGKITLKNSYRKYRPPMGASPR